MSLWSLALANVWSLRRRLVGLIVLVSAAVAVCLGAFAITGQAQSVTTNDVRESTANRSLTIDRPEEGSGNPLLTARSVKELGRLPRVESVQYRLQASFGLVTADGNGPLLYATTYRSALPPPVVKSVRKDLFPLREGEVVLPSRSQGFDLGAYLGEKVTATTTRFVREGEGTGVDEPVTVAGIYDATWQLDNPDAAYAADATVVKWAAARSGQPAKNYLDTVGYDQLTVVAQRESDVPELLRQVQDRHYTATTLRQVLHALPGILELIRVAGQALLAVLGVLAFVGTVTVTGALARQRAQEVGVLKAVGFRTRFVLGLLVAEMSLVAAVAAVLGVVLGVGLAGAGAAGLRTLPEVRPYVEQALPLPSVSVLVSLAAATVVVVAAGALAPARRAARMSPTQAMKDW
ncbi:ABC transporter permease [Streptomyces pyxinae]|uniref:ABC transporter permease n=1 Tax=Streptomyces pyxinae TaxID=2970734 RepID=UPI002868119B|nr:ABC transporter permease [Streptomyces sp. LP05-1]